MYGGNGDIAVPRPEHGDTVVFKCVRAVRGDVVLGHVRRNNVNARVQIVDNRFEQPAVVIVRYGLADIGGRLAVDGRHLVIFNVRACVELLEVLPFNIEQNDGGAFAWQFKDGANPSVEYDGTADNVPELTVTTRRRRRSRYR